MADYKLDTKNLGILKVGKWPQWSRKVKAALRANGTWSYVEGVNTSPPSLPTELDAWNAANDRIVGSLCGIIDDNLVQKVEKLSTAKAAWDLLKAKTHDGGTVAKSTALQNAMRTRFNAADTIPNMIAELNGHISTIFEEGLPTREDFTIILCLQALADGPFDWLRNQFITVMTSKTGVLTSDDIITRLLIEAAATEARSTAETVLVSKAKRKRTSRDAAKEK